MLRPLLLVFAMSVAVATQASAYEVSTMFPPTIDVPETPAPLDKLLKTGHG